MCPFIWGRSALSLTVEWTKKARLVLPTSLIFCKGVQTYIKVSYLSLHLWKVCPIIDKKARPFLLTSPIFCKGAQTYIRVSYYPLIWERIALKLTVARTKKLDCVLPHSLIFCKGVQTYIRVSYLSLHCGKNYPYINTC